MLSEPEPACLLIADISGYTSYLAGAELDHAQDILADLMTTVVGALRPGFRLAKLEGDAAFAYVLAERIDGSQLLDTVERTYFAFRRRLRDIAQATACECNACVLMPRLDLKVIAHHGSVIRHRIAGREELVGSDVIVAHRLLKNHVVERLGIDAYALFSAPCIDAMGVDPVALGMTEYRDTYDDLGEVVGWVHDLGAAWAAELERRRVVVVGTRRRVRPRDGPAGPPGHRLVVHDRPGDPAALAGRRDRRRRAADRAAARRRDDEPLHAWDGGPHRGDPRLAADRPRDASARPCRTASRPSRPVRVRGRRGRAPGSGSSSPGARTGASAKRARGRARLHRADLVERGQSNLHDVLVEEMARRAALAADAPPEPAAPGSLDRELREPIRL